MAQGLIYRGSTVGIAATAQNENLTQAEFEAITYVDICCPSEMPSVMEEAEIISEFCISGEEQTAVGASSGAETSISVYYKSSCIGQDILRDGYGGVGTQSQAFAFRMQLADGVVGVTTPTTIYFRALVTSKSVGGTGGGVNDLVTDEFGLKIAQPPILVKPEPV